MEMWRKLQPGGRYNYTLISFSLKKENVLDYPGRFGAASGKTFLAVLAFPVVKHQ